MNPHAPAKENKKKENTCTRENSFFFHRRKPGKDEGDCSAIVVGDPRARFSLDKVWGLFIVYLIGS
jgi:hypothetical protein